MGTNLFVEGSPVPFLIEVKMTREVTRLPQLAELARGLAEVEAEVLRTWSAQWPQIAGRKKRPVHLISFLVSSPPVFKILTDPAWLAVFLMILGGYKGAKESVAELSDDVGKTVRAVRGLSERELELLGIAVRLTTERALRGAEGMLSKTALRLRRTRLRIMGDSDEPPKIEVVDLDRDRFGW